MAESEFAEAQAEADALHEKFVEEARSKGIPLTVLAAAEMEASARVTALLRAVGREPSAELLHGLGVEATNCEAAREGWQL